MEEKKLPKGWVWTTVGGFMLEVKDRVGPENFNNAKYIGLEHLSKGGGIIKVGNADTLKSQKSAFKKGDILYGKLRPYLNKRAIVSFDGISSTDILVYRNAEDCSSKLFYYYLGLSETISRTNAQAKGINLPRISSKVLNQFTFPLPPLPEQKRITAKLDKLFGHLEVLRARLAAVPGLLADFRQSVLMQAYSGSWELEALQNVCIKIQDGAHHSPKVQHVSRGKNMFPYVTSKNIRNNFMDLTKITFVNKKFHDSIYQRCTPEYGDVLLTKDGANTGNVTLNTLNEPFSLLSSVCLIKTKEELLSASYLKFYIQSPIGFREITGNMTGTAIKRITLKKIKSAKIPLPPIGNQIRTVARVESLFAKADLIEARYQALKEKIESLPQAILAKAFRGELTEQLATDGDAQDLLAEIAKLRVEMKGRKKK